MILVVALLQLISENGWQNTGQVGYWSGSKRNNGSSVRTNKTKDKTSEIALSREIELSYGDHCRHVRATDVRRGNVLFQTLEH